MITASTDLTINLAPETTEEEIIQNIQTILATPKYTVPLDRGFGLSQEYLDKPHSVAKTMIVTDVFDAIEAYEPRVRVVEITFSSTDGITLIPTVEVEIIDNE